MSKTMDQHPNFREEVPIKDEQFKKMLLGVTEKLPDGWRLFSGMTPNGLHAMGCEMKGENAKSAPTLIQIPGFCHKSSAFRKTWLPHAQNGIQTIALTPPGTPPSIEVPQPIEKWGIEDYLDPLGEATKNIAEERDSLIIEGHSLGGLLALHICAQAMELEVARKKVKAWIGINSVKPPNVAQRLKQVEFPDGAEELNFKKHPQFFLEWVNGLFGAPTEERIHEKWTMGQIEEGCSSRRSAILTSLKEALRAREAKLPKDIQWIIEDRKSCRGSRNMINDYAFGIWAIEPHKIKIPLLDINGALDKEDITGTTMATKTGDIIEPVNFFADNSDIRLCNAKYFSMLDRLSGDNGRLLSSLETPQEAYKCQKQNWGVQAILREGTHNSPIEIDKQVCIVAELIRDFVKKIMDGTGAPREFSVFYR